MSDEKTQKERIESIFLDAQVLTGAERDRFLDEACEDETAIRLAVEKLLRADSRGDSLLDGTLDLLKTYRGAPEASAGDAIGPYKLLQRIGEGGFGVVYMAEQTSPVRRRVALKLIKAGMDSKEVMARFDAERQALAMMDHPNIARVLDAGATDSGRPYFAMELVKGVPITEYCDHNKLDTQRRLELFNYVCRAVQHAHQKGVIHRDLKPTNVMVTLHDGKAVPKVIDFGVAKALSQQLTEQTLFTRYGQVVGTPQYMSPEQAEMSGLDVDTRSDIYSLGILLYELLTGKTPLEAESLRTVGYDAMRRMICDSEPAKPSTRLRKLDHETASGVASLRSTAPHLLVKSLAGDLDWIVMKCLDKDRDRRYESANGLLNDVDRYLQDEPVEAGPPTFAYQLSKLYRRNRTAVATLAAIGAALLVGITLTSIAWANENEQRRLADEHRRIAEVALADSEESADEAQQQAEKARREATRAQSTLDVITSLLTKAAPDPEKGTEVQVGEFLRSFAEDLDAERLEDPVVEIQIRLTLAAALDRFSMAEEEGEQYEIAERIARQEFPPKSEELARFLLKRAEHLKYLNAVGHLEEALGCLAPNSNSKQLEVEIRTLLGKKLGWDKPVLSRAQMQRACDVARQMSDEEQSALATNPYNEFAAELLFQGDQATLGEQVANESVDFARRFGTPVDQVESLLMLRRFKPKSERDAYVEQAQRIAVQARDGAAMSKAMKAACAELWDGGFTRPDLHERANEFKDDLIKNWRHLHMHQPPLGKVWGMLMQTGDDEGASQLEALSKTMSPSARQVVAEGAGQWLRLVGMLRSADQMYSRGSDSLWNVVYAARCRSAARDFRAAIPLFEKVIGLTTEEEFTTPYWGQCELAIFLEAAGEPERARVIFERLVPGLLNAAHSGFEAVCLLCVAKSDRWDLVGSDQIRAIETKLTAHLAGGMKAHNIDEDRLGIMLTAAALGLLAEHRGDRAQQIEHFVTANSYRPGTFEQMNGEWISETVVQLLTEAGQIDRLEQVLRNDVRHRDESLPETHPERAFVRIRLAQMLIKHSRKFDEARQLLAEAAKVYAYHGDFIPAKEHEALRGLLQTVANSLAEER